MKLLCTLIVITCAAAAEASVACLDSAAAVWATNPHTHPTWRLIDGKRCWRAGSPHIAKAAYGWAPELRTSAVALPRAIPLPRARLDWELLHPGAYRRIDPQDGRALADELLQSTFDERWP